MSAVAEYHVGAGAFGIYAGTLTKSGKLWREKTDCTDEALIAVRDYLLGELPEGKTTGGYEWMRADGSIVELRVTVKAAQAEDEHMDCPCCGGHDTMVGTRARTSGHFHGRCTQCGARVME